MPTDNKRQLIKYYQEQIDSTYKQLSKNGEKRDKLKTVRITESSEKNKIDLDEQIEECDELEKELLKKIEELNNSIIDKDSFKDVKTDNTDSIEDRDDASQSKSAGVKSVFGNRNSAITPLTDEDTLTDLILLFQQGQDIENTLVYVATFFEGLSPYEFNQVVSILLRDKKTKIPIEKEVLTNEGEIKKLKDEEEKGTLDIWNENLGRPDQYLKKCHLKSSESKSSRIIDFTPPELREAMKDYLKEQQPLYLDHLFEKTQLFMFHPSIQVAKGGLTILTDAILTHPTVYDEQWIFQLVNNLAEREDWEIDVNHNLLQKIRQYFSQLEAESRQKIIFERVAGLLYFMLSNSSLETTVKRFLDEFMTQKRYDVVAAIVNQLDHVDEFDSLYWIKRLLDNSGDPNAISKAYGVLYRKLKSSGFRVYEILKNLYSWLPDADSPTSRYSPSAKASLSILVDYCSGTLSSFPEDDYGLYPSKYVLFKSFRKGEVEEKLDIIISWLFHPSENGSLAVESILENDDLSAISFLGSLIAEWFMILSGVNVKKQPETELENANAIEIMLRKIIFCTDKLRQQELSQFWGELSDYYLYKINRLPVTKSNVMRKSKSRLTQRRNSLRKLNKQFKSIRKSSKVEPFVVKEAK